MDFTLGTLPRAEGSCSMWNGDVSVVAAAKGPMEVRAREENPFKAAVSVNLEAAKGPTGLVYKRLEEQALASLEGSIYVKKYPRSAIHVDAKVLYAYDDSFEETSGYWPWTNEGRRIWACERAALLNAVFMSVINSGSIDMAYTPVAVSVGVDREGAVVVDPSPVQERRAKSIHVIVYSNNGAALPVVTVNSDGAFSYEEYEKAVDAGRGAAQGVVDALRAKVLSSYRT